MIHHNQALSLIRIETEKIFNETKNIYDTEFINIFNDGESIKDFTFELKSFIRFKYDKFEYPDKHSIIYVPVTDYFGVSYSTAQYKGKLAEAHSYGNYGHFYKEIYSKALNEKGNHIDVDKLTFMKADYYDITNSHYTTYYSINTDKKY